MTPCPTAAELAAKILTDLGFAQAVIAEPGADRRRDHIQSLIESALLSKLRAPVADERAALSQYDYQALFDAIGKAVKVHPNLSIEISVQAFRAALASGSLAKPKRAPLDDWRVQAIAECLEAEWDYMTPDQAEGDARLIVGYMIEYEKESDRIEAQHAAEPVHPVAQAVRNLRASAPVAGEAQKGWRLVPEKLTEEMRTAGEVVRSPSGTVSYGLSRHALALAWDALLSAAPSPPATHAAPQASEAQCSCPSGDGSLRWPCAVHAARPENGHLTKLAAALGNRDWKWWNSCSFRRLTFEDGPNRRDGSALLATVQASDGHPDVNMAPGVREFIEAASPMAVGQLAAIATRLEAQLRECADTLGADHIDEQRAMRAYADARALLDAMPTL